MRGKMLPKHSGQSGHDNPAFMTRVALPRAINRRVKNASPRNNVRITGSIRDARADIDIVFADGVFADGVFSNVVSAGVVFAVEVAPWAACVGGKVESDIGVQAPIMIYTTRQTSKKTLTALIGVGKYRCLTPLICPIF